MNLCGFEVGGQQPLFLIAGTCVVESEEVTLETAGRLKEIADRFGIPLRLNFYEVDELEFIVNRGAKLLDMPLGEDGAHEIACRGTGDTG